MTSIRKKLCSMKSSPKEQIKLTDQDKHNLAQFFDLLHKMDQEQNEE